MTDSAAATSPIYRGASPAALRLIASRALLDAAGAIRAYEAQAEWTDYAGYDVLRGACGLPPEEALALTRATALQALEALVHHLEADADEDFDRAVRALGLKLRSARTDTIHVPHHLRREPPARTSRPGKGAA